jgi:hypothetical protein
MVRVGTVLASVLLAAGLTFAPTTVRRRATGARALL